MLRIGLLVSVIVFLAPAPGPAFMAPEVIDRHQGLIRDLPVGQRIAFWAEQFVGTPYDPDPLGEYVRKKAVVADERVDCMYLAFRAVELSLTRGPADALLVALDKRFRGRGIMQEGRVLNYEDRYQYGEDMLDSGEWGREITRDLGRTRQISGSRGRDQVTILSRAELGRNTGRLHSGDLIFFVRNPAKRFSDEIVGHIGIIKKETNKAYLIHSSGLKNRGGKVKKTLLTDYLKTMPFIGVRVSRFEPENPWPE